MAKGEAMRRRAKNFMEAKETKSGRLLRLPPPPEAATKKGKRTSDMPRSLQRMLELKAVAQGPKHKKKKGPHNVERRLPAGGKKQTANGIGQKAAALQDCAIGSSPAEFPRPVDQTSSAARNGQLFSTPLHQAQAPALESKQEDGKAHISQVPGDSIGGQRRSSQQRALQQQQQQQQLISPAASSPGTKGLKARKKDFLKRRKLKKKGLLHLLEPEPEEDLETELMQDRHKPKFGEQAEAPLKIHLKRKHWDGGAQQQQQGRASKRCTDIFQRQMQDASRQQGSGASRLEHPQREAIRVPSTQKRKKWKQGGQAGGSAGSSLDTLALKHAQVQAQAIEAYRTSKRPDAASRASFKTLKELVRKGEIEGMVEG